MGNQYKLFIWDEVLLDYTYGIAFAVAKNIEDAKKIIIKTMEDDFSKLIEERKGEGIFADSLDMSWNDKKLIEMREDLNACEPIVKNLPAGGWINGGA